MNQNKTYINQLLQTENDQLIKLHTIVQNALDEEILITKSLSETNEDKKRTYGEQLADKVVKLGGSWTFILIFLSVLIFWIFLNSFLLLKNGFDPYPYILLNLILSCIAAIQAPIIMMSQNRKEAKDRKRAENDYLINLKAEIEIRNLNEKVDLLMADQFQHLCNIQQKQLEMLERLEQKDDSLDIYRSK